MGAWQVKVLATTAVLAAAVPMATDVVGPWMQHALKEGAHVRADLGGWIAEWRVERESVHTELTACTIVLEISP